MQFANDVTTITLASTAQLRAKLGPDFMRCKGKQKLIREYKTRLKKGFRLCADGQIREIRDAGWSSALSPR